MFKFDQTGFMSIFLDALNTLSDRRFGEEDLSRSFDEIGLDSMAFQQVIMYIEENTDTLIPEPVLESLAETGTLREFYDILRSHYSAVA